MINAQELRIGNRLRCQLTPGGPSVWIEVTGVVVSPAGVELFCWKPRTGPHGTMIPLSNGYEGIPLTEQVYRKCELVEGFHISACYGESKGIRISEIRYLYQIDEDHIRSIDYLHELQNLHYLLMEREIKINV